METMRQAVVTPDGLRALLHTLKSRGYRVVGPTLRENTIIYDDIEALEDLPAGWTDQQNGGRYRLERRKDNALFGYAVGPHSWKQFLHVPRLTLWRAERKGGDLRIAAEVQAPPKFAFIGVRSCELHAITIQDRVFLEGAYVDAHYRARRAGVFIVAINCGQAGGTCFCVSMGTGPKVDTGFDLALTEIVSDGAHRFLVDIGTDAGAAMLTEVPQRPATAADVETAASIVATTAASMGRQMEVADVKELLMRNLEHPRWQDVAQRCLTCGNCTMVCPTCFCTTIEDQSDLAGESAARSRRWDSCFTMDFSSVHGGSVRASSKSRYRQWLTHKLSTWYSQFGTSGCVGCGRCISWCPVGIDITEEVRALRENEHN